MTQTTKATQAETSPAAKAKKAAKVAEILKNFDALPDCACVQVPVVAALFGCSVPTIWRWAKDGNLPAPRKLSPGHTAWRVGDLRAKLGAAH